MAVSFNAFSVSWRGDFQLRMSWLSCTGPAGPSGSLVSGHFLSGSCLEGSTRLKRSAPTLTLNVSRTWLAGPHVPVGGFWMATVVPPPWALDLLTMTHEVLSP